MGCSVRGTIAAVFAAWLACACSMETEHVPIIISGVGDSLLVGQGSGGTGIRLGTRNRLLADGIDHSWGGDQGSDPVKYHGFSGALVASFDVGGDNDLADVYGPSGIVHPTHVLMEMVTNNVTAPFQDVYDDYSSVLDHGHDLEPDAVWMPMLIPYTGTEAVNAVTRNTWITTWNNVWMKRLVAEKRDSWTTGGCDLIPGFDGVYGIDPTSYFHPGPAGYAVAENQSYPYIRRAILGARPLRGSRGLPW